MPVFAQNLLDVKNTEIDELNGEISQLKDQLIQAQLLSIEETNAEQLVRVSKHTIPGIALKLKPSLDEAWRQHLILLVSFLEIKKFL
jgi:hypothetical protein